MQPERASTLETYLQFGRQLIAEQYLPHAGDTSVITEFRTVPHKFLVLCSSRTGSELLCYLLRDFGAATRETLHFLPDVAESLRQRAVPTIRDAMLALCRQGPPSVFSAKGTGMILLPLMLFDELPDHRDEWKFVILQRRDVLQQAISLAIAEKTGAWRADAAPVAYVSADHYDAAHILRCMDAIAKVNAHLARIESALGVETMRIDYEDLAADKRGIADRVGAFLGLPRQGEAAIEGLDHSVAPPRVQGTSLNSAWAARFRREEFDVRPRPARAGARTEPSRH